MIIAKGISPFDLAEPNVSLRETEPLSCLR